MYESPLHRGSYILVSTLYVILCDLDWSLNSLYNIYEIETKERKKERFIRVMYDKKKKRTKNLYHFDGGVVRNQ